MIRKMNEEDVRDVAALYNRYMYDSFLAIFGQAFIQIIFHGLVTSEFGINYVYECDGSIISFISAAISGRALFKQTLRKYKIQLLKAASLTLIKKPGLARSLFESFLYFRKTTTVNTEAEFLFIAVHPEYRNRGVAKELIMTTLAEFKERAITKVKVATLKENTAVNDLLKTLHFNPAGTFAFYGKENILYDFIIQ